MFVCKEHWILTIINLHKDEVCLFDPLNEGIVNDVCKDVVDIALKMFNAEMMANKPKKELRYGKPFFALFGFFGRKLAYF
ncbi:hypothetical protein ACS0TY_021380 [Phlomoides rotata]